MEMIAHQTVGQNGNARKVRPGLHQPGETVLFGLIEEKPLLDGAAGDVDGIAAGGGKDTQTSLFKAFASPDTGDFAGIWTGVHDKTPVGVYVQEDPDNRALNSLNLQKSPCSNFFFIKMHLLRFGLHKNAPVAFRSLRLGPRSSVLEMQQVRKTQHVRKISLERQHVRKICAQNFFKFFGCASICFLYSVRPYQPSEEMKKCAPIFY